MVETAAQTGIQGRIINVSSVIHSWVKRDGFRFNQMLNPKKYITFLNYINIYIYIYIYVFPYSHLIILFNHNGCSYNGTRAYAQSKLANILHAKELARQLKVELSLPFNGDSSIFSTTKQG